MIVPDTLTLNLPWNYQLRAASRDYASSPQSLEICLKVNLANRPLAQARPISYRARREPNWYTPPLVALPPSALGAGLRFAKENKFFVYPPNTC
jgi:hypothetical protein